GRRRRAGTETVSLPLNTVDPAPQSLKVQYAYYRGVFAWRPVLISLGLLVLGNLAGLVMVSGRLSSLLRARLRVAGSGNTRAGLALTPERLAGGKPPPTGHTRGAPPPRPPRPPPPSPA